MGADLLEVGSEAVHVLVVGQHGVSLGLEEVDVPDAQNGQQDGQVLLQRGAAEVVVLERRERPVRGNTETGQTCIRFVFVEKYNII